MPVSRASATRRRAAEVAREDVGHQAVLGVVGGGDRLLLGVEADDRRDGPKISSASTRLEGDVGEDGRAVEVAGPSSGPPPVSTVAPRSTASVTSSCTLSRCVASISGPTSVSGSTPRPSRSCSIRAAIRRANSSTTPACDVEAVRGGAGLAHVAQLRHHRLVDRELEVGVVEDEQRRVAAELHRDAQHAVHRARASARPTSVEPVNDSLRSRGSSNNGSVTCAGVRGRDDVQHPGRQAGLLKDRSRARASTAASASPA
jgi:hypothetical protein